MAKPNPVLVELGNLASQLMRVEANILAEIEKLKAALQEKQ